MTETNTEVTLSLMDRLTDEHRALVDAHIYSVHPSKEGSYPVLRWAAGPNLGQLAPGTGQAVGVPDGAAVGKATGWKNSKPYRQLLEKYISADLDEKKRGSLGWLLSQGMVAVEGGDVTKEVTCPECDHKFSTTMWKKPDANALKLLLEAVIGRADVTKDLNVNSEHIYRIIDERKDMRDLVVYEVSPAEREEREAIDVEWREISAGTK